MRWPRTTGGLVVSRVIALFAHAPPPHKHLYLSPRSVPAASLTGYEMQHVPVARHTAIMIHQIKRVGGHPPPLKRAAAGRTAARLSQQVFVLFGVLRTYNQEAI